MNREKYVEPIPSWALCAIINDDRTGLNDDEIRQIEDWFAETGYDLVCPPNDEDEGFLVMCTTACASSLFSVLRLGWRSMLH